MYRRIAFRWTKHIDFIVLDILCLVIALALAYRIRGIGNFGIFRNPDYRLLTLALVAVDFLVIVSMNTFKNVLKRGYLIEFAKTVMNALVLFAFGALVLFSTKTGETYSRLAIGYSSVIYVSLTYLVRLPYKKFLTKRIIPRRGTSLLVVTSSGDVPGFNIRYMDGSFNSYRLAGLALTDVENTSAEEPVIKVVASGDDISSWVLRNWVDEVLLILPPSEYCSELANNLMSMGITVHIEVPSIRGMEAIEKHVQTLGSYDVVTLCWTSASGSQLFLKRMLDIIGALVGCVFTLILTVIIGPMIYIASPGPIFFKQDRVGRNGKVFKMYKFRSMYPDAEARKKDFTALNRVSDGMMFKLDFDPRIIGNKELSDGSRKTGIGEFIRRTSLDEFPQFFNVLLGQMSLVGTRPPTLDEWVKYSDTQRSRMSMRPGITGLWQISGRSDITDFDEVVKLDTRYIANWSLYEDIRILARTVIIVFQRKGAR